MKSMSMIVMVLSIVFFSNGCMTSPPSNSRSSTIKRNFYKLKIDDTRKEVFTKLGVEQLDMISNNKIFQDEIAKTRKETTSKGKNPDLLMSIPLDQKKLFLYFDASDPDFKLKCAIIAPPTLSIIHEGFQEGVVYPKLTPTEGTPLNQNSAPASAKATADEPRKSGK